MSALEKLAAAKAALAAAEKEAETELAAQKSTTIAEIVDYMKEGKISLGELATYMRVAGSKYSQGTDTWSGKGKKPAFIEKHLAGGGKLEDLLTNKPAAA